MLSKLVSVDWGALTSGVWDYNVRSRFTTLTPKVLQLITNYRCNARCAMCNIWQLPHKHELTVAELKALMDPDPIYDDIDQLFIAGGEASLRTDLVEMIGYLVERMPKIRSLSLVSNGFLPKRILEQTSAVLKLIESRDIHSGRIHLAGWHRHGARPSARHHWRIRQGVGNPHRT